MSDISIIQLNNTECSNPSCLDFSNASENRMNNLSVNQRGNVTKNRQQINLNLKGHISNNHKIKKQIIRASPP